MPAKALHLPDCLPRSLAYLGRARQTPQTNTSYFVSGTKAKASSVGLVEQKAYPLGLGSSDFGVVSMNRLPSLSHNQDIEDALTCKEKPSALND